MLLKSTISSSRPYIIAGPCSVETPEQLERTLSSLPPQVSMIRGGIWKPRTRPDSFEGVGEIGLPWLVDAARAAGKPVTVEVANRQHVELALKAGIDVLWIGARTTVNPFAVQEIADALSGTGIPVMVKNPVNPDLGLWLGAIERFEKAGITDIAAVHRGFSVYRHPKYRNVPNWQIPIALLEERPDIPMICDPSHITGNRDLLEEVSQKALDLNFHGLMIETHCDPEHAWSDAAQQITPAGLSGLLDRLILRSSAVGKELESSLEEIRDKIAVLDERIFELLTARMDLSKEVGRFKKENNITILQKEHWASLIQSRLDKADDLDLSRVFIRQLMDAIHQESIRHQIRVMNSPEN